MTASEEAQSTRSRQVYARLAQAYGEQERRHEADPLDMLIGTMLSANTNDVNSGRAFRELQEHFDGDWDAVCNAPLDEVKDAIRVAGMYNQKAPNIVNTLRQIRADQGEYSLDVVAEMDVEEAVAYLTSLPGVGHKTASIVLLFRFGMGTFPVDTHVQRISQRLGISDVAASPKKVKDTWEALLPAETYYTLHVNLIRHGRQVCHARGPKCEPCVVQDMCDYYQQRGDWREQGG